ncbi:TerD family protein [Paenibacillus campi]|uniref:TerD family protein n=1 Tax=Paenibacillus campi TaxID=3106031 RepID=UPI002AFF0CBD|nr:MULTISPECIES: TerD family protein [unclassified Paenibacillus]
MSTIIVRGQKTDVTKNRPGISQLSLLLGWQAPDAIELDTSAFLLQANGRVASDDDLIFYGNASNGFIRYMEQGDGTDRRRFDIQLAVIPQQVDKIAITLTIYNAEVPGHTFSRMQQMYIRGVVDAGAIELFRYNLESGFSDETAIVIGELYRYQGEWKFAAVGAGYFGGLQELCGSYGVEVEAPAEQQGTPPPPTPPSPPGGQSSDRQLPPPAPPHRQPSPPPFAPSGQSSDQQLRPPASSMPPSPLNLSKIELKKKGDVINLQKKPGTSLGELLINLNWNRQQRKSGGLFGFGGSASKGTDLDLGCLYELQDGSKGVVQALGNRFGSLDMHPYISLDADDRTGERTNGENMRINGNRLSEIKRVLVFSFIYEGISRWSEADGVVTIYQQNGPDIIVRLDEPDNRRTMCAIAMIRNVGDTFSIEKVVQYFSGHREMDLAFNWNMRWTAGRK